MIQLYFLSVLCNGLCGYLLFAGNENQKSEKMPFPGNNPTFHLGLGIVSVVIGFLKLLSPSMGVGMSKMLIFGDLIPAAAGIIAGFLVIFGIYRNDKSLTQIESKGSESSLDILAAGLLRFRKPLGLILLATALIHFLFPDTLFL
ncbi:MAG: hypothetical protein LBQ93_07445 [Treponema sp.]|jgi:hypothetical protein|nr:hypothetical protein [Treponema sp.]